VVEATLYGLEGVAPPEAGSFLPMGGKRTLTMLALRHLHAHAPKPVDTVALAEGSPFGAVEVNAEGCTTCLACVGACPTGALTDNPEQPMVRFQEDACVQCGLCRSTCPESVITLVPRLNFHGDARGQTVLKEEESFACVRCGKSFGVRSSIERMVEKLADHSMFAGDDDALDRIRMCEDCRVMVQFEAPQPMAARPKPTTRTTDDDQREREQKKAREMHDKAQGGTPADSPSNKNDGGGT
jgi:ferredoxin